MNFETVILEVKDHIATITMNRPDKMNSCSVQMFREIEQALGLIEDDPEVRVVVLTGAGDKAFSAGVDINELNFKNVAESNDWIKYDARMFRRLETIPQPVIAAVNGLAYGYGCKIPIVCDLAIASTEARFGLQGIKLSAVHIITLGRGRDTMSRKDLAYLVLSGETFDAQEAASIGIINKAVAPEDLYTEVYKLAKKIANYPSYPVQIIKRMLHRGMDEDYRYEELLSPSLLLLEDVKEGREAFIQKRKPNFKGY